MTFVDGKVPPSIKPSIILEPINTSKSNHIAQKVKKVKTSEESTLNPKIHFPPMISESLIMSET